MNNMKQFAELTAEMEAEIVSLPLFDLLPLGQKLMKIKLEPTTHKDLRNWFKCDEVTKIENDKINRRAHVQKHWDNRKKHNSIVNDFKYSPDNVRMINLRHSFGQEKQTLADYLKSYWSTKKPYRSYGAPLPMTGGADYGFLDESAMVMRGVGDATQISNELMTMELSGRMERALNGNRLVDMGQWNRIQWNTVECDVSYCPLNEYMKDEIPDYVIEQLQTARAFGFDTFEVAYPEMKNVELPDPVLLGVLGNKKFFITFWE